jgi:NADPH2:quinone reductase
MRAIAPGGRILVVGFTSGQWAQARTNVLFVKMISVIGVEARLAVETTGGKGMADYRRMLDWIADGRIVPQVGRVYRFEEALDGYVDILARRHIGKSVLAVNPAVGR